MSLASVVPSNGLRGKEDRQAHQSMNLTTGPWRGEKMLADGQGEVLGRGKEEGRDCIRHVVVEQ